MSYTIKHDREECTGCESCVKLASKYWEMNRDGKSDLKNCHQNQRVIESDEDFEENMNAAYSCPVNVIHIRKDEKDLI